MQTLKALKSLVLFSPLLFFATPAQAQTKGNLIVEISGFKTLAGEVCLNLFANSSGFPSDSEKALQKKCVPVTESPTRVTFENIPFASYAVSAFHDVNGDNKLNRDGLGIPAEAFGFSNNPNVSTSAPKYREAIFLAVGQATVIQIQLKHGIDP